MAKHIIKHFHHRVATPFQLFHTERYSNMYHRCLPLTGTSNAVVVKKNRDFWPIFLFISETIQDRAIVTMECE